jgi:hypothetical protein
MFYKDSKKPHVDTTQNDLFMFSSANAQVYKRYEKNAGIRMKITFLPFQREKTPMKFGSAPSME